MSRLDTFSKLLQGVSFILASILIPYVIHINSERNRSNELYANILSQRERSDSELRGKMLENLIRGFFGEGTKSFDEKITLLTLLSSNFNDSFNLKPLYEEMESQLKSGEGAAPGGKKEEFRLKRMRLQNFTRDMASRQVARLASVKEGMLFSGELREGIENGISLPPSGQPPYKGHRLGIVVTEANDESAKIKVVDLPEGDKYTGDNAEMEFLINYYDMPFVDNTKLFDGTRFSVVLNDIARAREKGAAGRTVNLRVVFFPETYMTGRDKPFLDEMLEQLKAGRGILSKKAG